MIEKNKLVKGKDYIGVGVGAIVFNDKGEVLLNKRGSKARNERGKWEFPGGGVRFGETCEEAVRREIKEEFDIEIEIERLLHFVDHIIRDEGQHWVSPTFIAKVKSGTPQIMESEKSEAFKWQKPSEIDKKELTTITLEDLEYYLEVTGEKK